MYVCTYVYTTIVPYYLYQLCILYLYIYIHICMYMHMRIIQLYAFRYLDRDIHEIGLSQPVYFLVVSQLTNSYFGCYVCVSRTPGHEGSRRISEFAQASKVKVLFGPAKPYSQPPILFPHNFHGNLLQLVPMAMAALWLAMGGSAWPALLALTGRRSQGLGERVLWWVIRMG